MRAAASCVFFNNERWRVKPSLIFLPPQTNAAGDVFVRCRDAFPLAERRRVQFIHFTGGPFDLLDKVLSSPASIIVRPVATGRHAIGSLTESDAEECRTRKAEACADVLVEALHLARFFDLPLPRDLSIVAIEVPNAFEAPGAVQRGLERGIISLSRRIRVLLSHMPHDADDAASPRRTPRHTS